MGKSNDTTTTVQKADPWKPTQSYLKGALGDAQQLYSQGGFAADPFPGQRVANFSPESRMGMSAMMQQAQQPGSVGAAQGTLANMMDPGYQSSQLDAVKQNALGSAVPAAVSQFAGSGMENSSQAMDFVGRAASEAVAPYEYDAFNQSQTNALRGAALAPSVDAASYMPSQMMQGVGAMRDAKSQDVIDSAMRRWYESQGTPANNLRGYSDMLLGYGGQGGTQTGSQTQPGVGMGQKIGSSALGGLGTYGALAMNPATAPFAMMGGLGAGLLGLF